MNPKLFTVSERILLTLWVGSMWTSGYIIAPLLFSTIDRKLAGDIGGHMFAVISYVGLACGALLLIAAVYQLGRSWLRDWRVWVLVGMVALVVVGQFVLQPQMEALKALGLVEGSVVATQFGRLHGIAASLFMVTSLLGLVLVIAGERRN